MNSKIRDSKVIELNRFLELLELVSIDSHTINLEIEGEHKKVSTSIIRNTTTSRSAWEFGHVLIKDKNE